MSITAKRNLVLWLVNALILAHIIVWYGFGKWGLGTISPQGGLDILVDGILTGSAIFTVALVILTLAFGRLACGWGCHFAAFQETSTALLKRLGIAPRPLHSRASVVRYLFLGLLLYTPVRSIITKGLPNFGEMSLNNVEVFTPDLPTGIILIATILVSAALITGLFGSRPFCRYVCPWALVFRFLDRVSPTRIRQMKECEKCRTCSDNCVMGIDVQKEIEAHGYVRTTECVRCLTCTKGCPNGALAYSPRSAGFSPGGEYTPPRSSFGWATDIALLVPAVAIAFLFNHKLDNFQGWLGAAWGLSLGLCTVRLFTAGDRNTRMMAVIGTLVLAAGVAYVALTETQMGRYNTGKAVWARGDAMTAEWHFRQALALDPDSSRSFDIRQHLAWAVEAQGHPEEAIAIYREMILQKPYYAAKASYNMALVQTKLGRFNDAAANYRVAVECRPGWAEAHYNLAYCWRELGEDAEAERELRTALSLDPSLTPTGALSGGPDSSGSD